MSDLSDIKDDIAFIKQKLDEKIKEKEQQVPEKQKTEDKYQILDNNREVEESKESNSWFW